MIRSLFICSFIILITSCNSQEKTSSFNPDAIELNNVAVDLMLSGEYDSALIIFDKAIELDNSYYLPHSSKSNIYISRKEFEKALNESEIVLKKQPDLAEGWVFSGMLYDRKGDSLTAMKYYHNSIEIFTNRLSNPEKQNMIFANKLNRAFSYILIGQIDKGKKELNALKNEEPENFMIDHLLNTSKEQYLNQLFGN